MMTALTDRSTAPEQPGKERNRQNVATAATRRDSRHRKTPKMTLQSSDRLGKVRTVMGGRDGSGATGYHGACRIWMWVDIPRCRWLAPALAALLVLLCHKKGAVLSVPHHGQ